MNSLILIIFVIVFIAAILLIGPLVTRKLSVRLNLIIAGVFPALLAVLAVIAAVLPASLLTPTLDPGNTDDYSENYKAVIEGIKSGSFKTPEGFTKTETTFNAAPGSISVACDDKLQGMVFVGAKGVDAPNNGDNRIDVYTFTAGNVAYHDAYYSIGIAPPVVALVNNNLSIKPAGMQTIDFFQFNDRYALPQFFDQESTINGAGIYKYTAVVVLLPPGVTAEGSGYQNLDTLA